MLLRSTLMLLLWIQLPTLAFSLEMPERPEPPFWFHPSQTDFGGHGLLQIPSARVGGDGSFYFGYSRQLPYNRLFLSITPIPFIEATVRYNEITDRPYGSGSWSAQTLKDKGIDIKCRLLQESYYLPALAIGARDLAGTGLFSSEYIVASKRFYDVDVTLGMGWGNLGTRGHVKNPLRFISDHFDSRDADRGQGGEVSFGDLFSGEKVSLFGGIEYRTAIDGLSLKLEYDGNDYSREPASSQFEIDSPINFGAVYRPYEWLDLSLGWERGNELTFSLIFRSNFHKAKEQIKPLDPPEPTKVAASVSKSTVIDSKRISSHARKAGFDPVAISHNEMRITLYGEQKRYRNEVKGTIRAAHSVFQILPENFDSLSLVSGKDGVWKHQINLSRNTLDDLVTYKRPIEMLKNEIEIIEPPVIISPEAQEAGDSFPRFHWEVLPKLNKSMGGPIRFVFYEIYLNPKFALKMTPNWRFDSSLSIPLVDNYDAFTLPSDSVLPHVRTDIRRYLKEGQLGIRQLQTNYFTGFGNGFYGQVYAGLLERMFGGVGAEFLYKSWNSSWAVDVNINWVKQRQYDQRFSFLDYSVVTGHINYYQKLPWYNLTAKLSVGQYLAKDKGATFALQRQFDSGITAGAWVTKTDVSAEEFGEGSFDKGFFISIPYDLILFKSSQEFARFSWSPLTRDGGQMLSRKYKLYSMVSDRGSDTFFEGFDQEGVRQ